MSEVTNFSQSLLFLLPFVALPLTAATVSGGLRLIVVTEAQNGQDVRIGTKGVLIVRLRAQAGTGYSWAITDAPPFLRLSEEHNEPAGRPIPDGPEFQLFTFKPTGSGNAPLSFAYRRPWEASQPPARTYNVKVTVSTR
jgi:predicted secreted protein